MSARRKLLLGLLILPFAFFVYSLIWPFSIADKSNLVEVVFLVIGTPIVVFNVWEWQDPDSLDDLFNQGDKSMTTASTPKKNNTVLIVVAVIAGLIILVCFSCLALSFIGNNLKSQPTSAAVQPTEINMDAILTAAVQTVMADQTQSASQSATQAPEPASTETPQPSANSNFGKVGERIEQGGIALTVVNVSKVASVNDFLKPEPGNTYVVVEVIIENISRDDETPYNPLYFSIKDADGFQYTVSMLAPDPMLSSGNLVKGDKVRGNVAFEVKESASGLVVSYEPLVMLGGYQTIRINLGQ